MTDSISPQQPLADMAELARILGHHHRLILLEHIARGEQPVERLVEASGLSVANTSQHLQQLRRGGFVQTRRDGKRVLYSLSQGPLAALLGACANTSITTTGRSVSCWPTASSSRGAWRASPGKSCANACRRAA
ncbi:ArsR/SmtB family transcription factor [Pseudomonas protegens]|uniref:ArsR/SmtB family transcription factor n=1 Tax=Pseudomonas protegens TaxID=380021 RepID=UPI001CDACA7E|nr:metalloregulator ArsR/SmtB family transcription factor [Pseudomonas protegens]